MCLCSYYDSEESAMIERQIKTTNPLKCPKCGKDAHIYSRGSTYYAECFPCLLRTAPTENLTTLEGQWFVLANTELSVDLLKHARAVQAAVTNIKPRLQGAKR